MLGTLSLLNIYQRTIMTICYIRYPSNTSRLYNKTFVVDWNTPTTPWNSLTSKGSLWTGPTAGMLRNCAWKYPIQFLGDMLHDDKLPKGTPIEFILFRTILIRSVIKVHFINDFAGDVGGREYRDGRNITSKMQGISRATWSYSDNRLPPLPPATIRVLVCRYLRPIIQLHVRWENWSISVWFRLKESLQITMCTSLSIRVN